MTGYSAVGVVGSRKFPSEEMARKVIRKMLGQNPAAVFISGCAHGADTWGEEEAKAAGRAFVPKPPEPEKFGGNFAAAALARNTEIVDAATLILAFWDGKSTGTKDTIDKAMKARKDTVVVYPDGHFMKVGYGNVYGGFGD
jgi:hypothetical protein